jgi:hypothetical protein
MKKILLGMAGVRAKVRGGEAAQPFFASTATQRRNA